MAQLQKTDLRAYETDLAEAEKDFVAAAGRVAAAQNALNNRRIEEGLEPLDFSEDTDSDNPQEDDTPEEATGFGVARRNGGKK